MTTEAKTREQQSATSQGGQQGATGQSGQPGTMTQQGSSQGGQQTATGQRGELRRGQQQGGGYMQRQPYSALGLSLTPMELLGLNPFQLMRRMTEEIDRTFGSIAARGGEDTRGMWTPAMEVIERDDAIVVRSELPGLAPDDVRVEVRDNALIIEGERRDEIERDEGGTRHSERRYGRFFRTVVLPEGADLEKANARFENGLLEVTIPLLQDARQNRRIPIQGGREGAGAREGAAGREAAGRAGEGANRPTEGASR